MKLNKTGFRYGFTAFLLMVFIMIPVWWTIHKVGNYDIAMPISYAAMAVALTPIVFALLRKRIDNQNELSFGSALGTSMLVAFFACIGYLTAWLIIEQIMPDLPERLWNLKLKDFGSNPTTEELEQWAKYKVNYQNIWYRIGYILNDVVPFAVIIALLSSLALKKSKKA